MNSWLYTALNRRAKAWRYHVNNRPAQRESIRRYLGDIRNALSTEGAYASLQKGGNSANLYPKEGTSISGMHPDMFDIFKKLGIPCLDFNTASFDTLLPVIWRAPLVAVGRKPTEDASSWGYRPLAEVAKLYKDAGVTVYNIAGL